MNDNTALKVDPRTLRFPALDEDTERENSAAAVFLPKTATWRQIRKRMYTFHLGPFSDPESWEMTMKAYFGEDLFVKQHQAP